MVRQLSPSYRVFDHPRWITLSRRRCN